MPIKFNEVTWYSKLGAVILFLVIVPSLMFYIGIKYEETKLIIADQKTVEAPKDLPPSPLSLAREALLDGTYTFDGKNITLTNGLSEQTIVPGSASKVITRVFGEPVIGDLDQDGVDDAIFFVTQETGGSGTFFYVIAALRKGGAYQGLPAFLIGDRIAPQNISINKGIARVNYATRGASDAMSVETSTGITKYLFVEQGILVQGNASTKLVPPKTTQISSTQADRLFESKKGETNTSNIVGYFAGGAFYWYIPAWLEENWKITDAVETEGFVISPKVSLEGRPFSDISIGVQDTSESFNAVYLYDNDVAHKNGTLRIHEVLLNKHGDGMLTIQMETNSRIYHTQREVSGKVYDRYYIDGSKEKTASIIFTADTDQFSKYESKIREFVEGIGPAIQQQG